MGDIHISLITWISVKYDELFMSRVSIVTSRRRVEIQSTSEMTPYFTMTKCVINCLLHTLLAQLNAYQLFHPFNTREIYGVRYRLLSHATRNRKMYSEM